MSQQRSQAGARRGDVRGWHQARVALAAGLLAVVAVGLRGHVPPPALSGPFRHDGLAIGITLEAVLACLLAALAVRRRRAPRDALLAGRLRQMLSYVVITGLVTIPALYLLGRHVRLARPPRLPGAGSGPGTVPRPAHPGSYTAGQVLVIIIAVLVAAALIYGAARLVAMRHGFWAGWRGHAVGTVVGRPAGDEPGLREAVESGQAALRGLDDARAAIIACYLAMERALARAGASRAASDTPYELLARAADRGLVPGEGATRLTAMFCAARFSSHPMPPAARGAAERALGELAARLGDSGPHRAERAAGGAGGTGAADREVPGGADGREGRA
jgi:Domain of unknown function (DUF4129)